MRKKLLTFLLLACTGMAMAQSYTYSLPTGYTDNNGTDEIHPLTSEQLMAKTESTYLLLKCVAKNNYQYYKGTSSGTPADFSNIESDYVFVWEPVSGETGKFYLRKTDGKYIQLAGNEGAITLGTIDNAAKFYTTQPVSDGSSDENDYNADGSENYYYEGSEYFVRFVNDNGVWINVQQPTGTPKYNKGKGSFTFVYAYEVTATEIVVDIETEKNNALALLDEIPYAVGYPTQNAREQFTTSVNAATTIADIESATTTLYTTTDVNMPVDGKAYTFTNITNEGEKSYLNWNGTAVVAVGLEDGTTIPETATFICRLLDNGKYVFVNNAGKYLTFQCDQTVYCPDGVGNGFLDAYNTDNGYCDWAITSGGLTNEYLFGTLLLEVQAVGKVNYLLQKYSTHTFHSGNKGDLHNDGDLSSYWKIEEATYANTPVLNTIAGNLISGIQGNISTFSAPFATVIPEGVTAYYIAAADAESATLTPVATEALPANEGFLLVSDTQGAVTMKPATTETVADVSGNMLDHSAGAGKIVGTGSGYILTSVDGNVGFYICNGGTLAMNKAYLENPSLTGDVQSIKIKLPGTTAIDEVESENSDAEVIYDLSGRRIDTITAPGIYIVNGKKVIK